MSTRDHYQMALANAGAAAVFLGGVDVGDYCILANGRLHKADRKAEGALQLVRRESAAGGVVTVTIEVGPH